ncbi:4017_t:CDS:2 [Funneliformis mosseae]|uniref:4017_t:CDS:1 n=1 Tax=Funneliformis mosseae TaxID=27381 RepID=A0A9N9EY24_FUNMO|nr:4017_t:CDS:2 [Funneliformis mosseae]
MRKTIFMIIGAALLNIIITINAINVQSPQPPPRSYQDGNFFYNKMRSDLTSILSNDKIYFFGGETFNKSDSSQKISNELFTLDVSSLDLNNSNDTFNTESLGENKWELLDSMKVGLKHNLIALSARDDYSTIIIYGGETFIPNTDKSIKVESQIYEYDINAKKWTMNPKYRGKPPPNRLSFASYAQNLEDGMIYLFGGISNDGRKINNKLYSIDTNDKRWNEETADDAPPGVFGSACTLLKDGKIVFIGGANFGDLDKLTLSQMNKLNIYDTVNGKWSIRSTSDKNLPEGRIGHTVTLYDNKIIIIGGINLKNEKASVPYLFYLDLDEWDWKNLKSDQSNYNGFARFGHNTILHDDHLFVTFGQSTNENDEINPIEAINADNLERIIQPPRNSNKEKGENNNNPVGLPEEGVIYDNPATDVTPNSLEKDNSVILTLSIVGGIFLMIIILTALLLIYIKRRKFKIGNDINSNKTTSILPVTTRNITRKKVPTLFRDSTSTHNTTYYPNIVNESIGDIQNANNVKTTTVKPKTPTVIYASGVSSVFADLLFTGSIEDTNESNDDVDASGFYRSKTDLDVVEEVQEVLTP